MNENHITIPIEDDLCFQTSSKSTDFSLDYAFEYVSTDCGYMYVAFSKDLKGQPSKPVILTFHDVGFNHRTSFERFFQFSKMQYILKHFNLVHLNAPGQELFAKSIDSSYPTLDQIADGVGQVIEHFGINEFVGFGVGAGANILTRFALKYPDSVNGLLLMDTSFNNVGLFDSLKSSLVAQVLLSENKMSRMVWKFVLRQFFSKEKIVFAPTMDNYVCANIAKPHYLHPAFNVHNFALFLQTFLNRSKLTLHRQSKNQLILCPVLLITGEHSSRLNDSEEMASRLNPANSSFIKLSESKDAMQDEPKAVADAFALFLLGLGYILKYRLVGIQGDELLGAEDSK